MRTLRPVADAPPPALTIERVRVCTEDVKGLSPCKPVVKSAVLAHITGSLPDCREEDGFVYKLYTNPVASSESCICCVTLGCSEPRAHLLLCQHQAERNVHT